MTSLTCFKAYDIRGKLGDELNPDIVYRIGRAFAQYLNAKKVVIGGDIRLSTPELKSALADGIMAAGCDVIDIGLCGTEEIYFATSHLNTDGGIVVTASHNPKDYNGLKLVRENSKPISGDTGLFDIRAIAEQSLFSRVEQQGKLTQVSNLDDYVGHLLTYISPEKLKPLKLVVNAGNGAAGHVVNALEQAFQEQKLPVEFIKVFNEPDGNFPNGIPNPLLPENRGVTREAVIKHKADMGIAWDGDFDRCFLFDENGDFIEGYYIVGLLAEAFLQKHSHEKIIHDPRLTLNTIDIVENNKGIAIQSKTGHAFIKERMRLENAVYGGEMSAHHYFRDFNYCDSGMIPWLLVAELISLTGTSLSAMVSDRIAKFPSSGEINRKVADADLVLAKVDAHYRDSAREKEEVDGLSLAFDGWRLNIRKSNTEPLLRLNIESEGDVDLMERKTRELIAFIESV
ncbi:phosphomannomutase/phosphoglucomutase [Thalassomonas actiniarum]|uniref:phosphomannomutase n=1 Tax=Thalassomonas actiniarum TaxID=485447 RepID=A0AAE9YQZ6_9GAMM|nr:phosphomannomutase/phosphoglucomutase [Thalassomonas actiniarum]WDD99465.1 phosphomannomutase/phosphoglucomutase [Thalassomonas actiniarum]